MSEVLVVVCEERDDVCSRTRGGVLVERLLLPIESVFIDEAADAFLCTPAIAWTAKRADVLRVPTDAEVAATACATAVLPAVDAAAAANRGDDLRTAAAVSPTGAATVASDAVDAAAAALKRADLRVPAGAAAAADAVDAAAAASKRL